MNFIVPECYSGSIIFLNGRKTMSKTLAHLNYDQIEDVMQKYYAGEKISNLLHEYQVTATPSAIVSLFPPFTHQDLFCPYCEAVNMESKRKSRSSGSKTLAVPTCPECDHKDAENCRCSFCVSERKASLEKKNNIKRDIIHKTYSDKEAVCANIEDLTFQDALYLLSLVKHSASEDLVFVDPFNVQKPILAPTFDIQKSIVEELESKGLINVSLGSDIDAFAFDEEDTVLRGYYPTRVLWELLPNMTICEKNHYLRALRKRVSDDWTELWRDQISSVWREITKNECLEYYCYLIGQRNIPLPEFGDKTHAVFDDLLNYFSPSQVCSITWQAVRDTMDYMVRDNLPKYRVKTMFIGAIQRKADKYRAEGWEAHRAGRDYNCPQSVISCAFFDTFMQIGKEYFDKLAPPLNEV